MNFEDICDIRLELLSYYTDYVNKVNGWVKEHGIGKNVLKKEREWMGTESRIWTSLFHQRKPKGCFSYKGLTNVQDSLGRIIVMEDCTECDSLDLCVDYIDKAKTEVNRKRSLGVI